MSDPRDIRMRGFQHRSPVEAGWAYLREHTSFVQEEEVIDLDDATGRVLSLDVTPRSAIPDFARSAMDGFALRSEETNGASPSSPCALRIVGSSFPGRECTSVVVPGSTVRIMTGAPLPHGANAVLPVELSRATSDSSIVEAIASVSSGKNVTLPGEDIQVGQLLLPKGRCLRPQDVAVLASLGMTKCVVWAKPTVSILVTGNELVAPGSERQRFEIYDANTSLLRSLVQRDGGVVAESLRLGDSRDSFRKALLHASADVVLISGGSSVGLEDFAPIVVRELGELPIHGLALRPAGPAGIGRIGRKLVFLLPGNPVACLCAYDFFAGRAIRRMAVRRGDWPYETRSLSLSHAVESEVGRMDYVRVRMVGNRAEPLAVRGASSLSSTVVADGFFLIRPSDSGYAAGTQVQVYLYDGTS